MEQPEWGKSLAKYFIVPQRVNLAIMCCLAILVSYALRICISVAIVVMVVKRERDENDDSNEVCPPDPGVRGDEDQEGGEYDWSEERQGLILSAFFWGYLITHIPGGMITDKFGGKWALASGLLLSSLCSIASPLAVRQGGSLALVAVRVLMGAAQGVVYPSVFLCYGDPISHPFIKESEREYLKEKMGSIGRKKDHPPVPWKAIFANAAVIAMIIAQLGHDWGFFFMVIDLPKYMGEVLQVSIKQNGLDNSLPYMLMYIVSILSGICSDWLMKDDFMTITEVRKWMTSIAAFGSAIFMVGASYAECKKLLVVILFTISMGFMGAFYAGMKLSPLDMSPNYAGTLMAIKNGFGALAIIAEPYVVGVMTPHSSLKEWRMVFWVAFVALCSTCVPFIIWGSGEVQDFNNPPPKKEAVAVD